ncbi:permease [Paenibacillus sp. MSJ-34]|uniref:permease n=1 Tax=Paenibacillus sp. MSJ-34 TaxID=2841529 RepID=UPI00345F7DCC
MLIRTISNRALFMLIWIAAFFTVIVLNWDAVGRPAAESAHVQSFKVMFISILLEALPFVLLGVFISSLLHIFVSERTISRFIPKHPLPGIVFACLLGIVFPICECGMIPVVRRLLRKGMPLYMATVFVLAGPIINPIVYASTFMAFRSQPEMAYSRMGLAFVVAAFIGLYIHKFVRKSDLAIRGAQANGLDRGAISHAHASCGNHGHEHKHDRSLSSVLRHASDEFFEMGKYLILGALITAAIQTFMARESILAIGQGEWSSQFFMMGFAYLLSICSTSDAFVASSFASMFTGGSILTFLVFGAMLDFKGTLMLLSVFKKKYVLLIAALLIVSVPLGSVLFQYVLLQ